MILGSLSLGLMGSAQARTRVLKDPRGDDKGPGTYVYPTDAAYKAGAFDITKVTIKDKGKRVEIQVRVATTIDDPWNSSEWNGNGFSVQFAQVYFDLDHVEGSGSTRGLPGTNVLFEPKSAWDKVVLISPQPATRVQTEIDLKAADLKKDIIIPKVTRAQGNNLMAIVSKSDLGGSLPKTFGVQVLMQSNEGYPDATDLLTRKVNEYNGPHRFGGGSDYDCDPHVMDILMTPAQGGDEEAQAQYDVLKRYVCDEDESKWVQAVLPMVYPGS